MLVHVTCPDCNQRTIHADVDVTWGYAGNRVEPGFAGSVELNSFKFDCHCFEEYEGDALGNEVPIMEGSPGAAYILELERILEDYVLGGEYEEEQREAAAERRWEERSGR